MLALRLPCVAGLAVLLGTAAAVPYSPEEGRAQLELLYRLSVAIDSCDDIDLSEAEENKLDKTITDLEGKLALTEQAAQDWYTQMSAAADKDKDGFCKEAVPLLKPTIDKLPD
jgi:hypothetical protein